MKQLLFVLLFITQNTWCQDLLTPGEKNSMRVHFSSFINLEKKEMNRIPDIFVISDSIEHFWGKTSRQDQRIIIDSHLFKHGQRSELLATLVHEKTHLGYYLIKPDEEDLILEGSALVSEFIFLNENKGKDQAIKSFLPLLKSLDSSQLSLKGFQNDASGYALAFLFYLYAYENFGQSDFSQQHIRVSAKGIEGLVEATIMNKSFVLTPKSWKNPAFLISSFYWSLINKKNMITTRANDLFTQLIGYLKPITPNTMQRSIHVAPNGMALLQDKESYCPGSQYSIAGLKDVSPYKLSPKLIKTFIQDEDFTLLAEESLLLINLSDEEKILSIECK